LLHGKRHRQRTGSNFWTPAILSTTDFGEDRGLDVGRFHDEVALYRSWDVPGIPAS